jgi:adenylate cyclase
VRTRSLRDAGLSDESILEVGRVMARGTFGVASAVARVFNETFSEAGDDEQSLALRYADASRELTPLLGPVIEHVLGVQQRSLIRQAAVDLTALEDGRLPQGEEVTICFADLVGFTRLGENLDPAELGAVAERLETLAIEVAEAPVRLIKTIGDAVMLQSPDTDALLGAGLALVEAADSQPDEFPPLRAGLARGVALERAGDWFGRPVNRASRIADVARPSSVLVEAAVKDAAEGPWRFSAAGKRPLKGVKGSVSLHRARRREAEDDGGSG